MKILTCGFLLLLTPTLLAEKPPTPDLWWKVLPAIEDPFGGGHHDSEDPAITALCKKTEFKEWTTYEDEFVTLRYPKDPLLRFEVKEGDGGIQVEGGVCTTVDNSFSRAYVLSAGDATYQVWLLNPADWLDDGI